MQTNVVDTSNGDSLTFFHDPAVLNCTAAYDGSPLRSVGTNEFSWEPVDDERLTKASLACALYVWGATYDEVAILYGVTRERVRQILSKYAAMTIDEIKERRRGNIAAIASQVVAANSALIADYLSANGPSTIDETAAATGLSRSATKLAWPSELAHLQLTHVQAATHPMW